MLDKTYSTTALLINSSCSIEIGHSFIVQHIFTIPLSWRHCEFYQLFSAPYISKLASLVKKGDLDLRNCKTFLRPKEVKIRKRNNWSFVTCLLFQYLINEPYLLDDSRKNPNSRESEGVEDMNFQGYTEWRAWCEDSPGTN